MGYYIQTETPKGKALIIKNACKGTLIPQPAKFSDISADLGLICVVDNGFFEAAGFCYSEAEFKAFTEPHDTRPRQWLTIGRKEAERLSRFDGGEYR